MSMIQLRSSTSVWCEQMLLPLLGKLQTHTTWVWAMQVHFYTESFQLIRTGQTCVIQGHLCSWESTHAGHRCSYTCSYSRFSTVWEDSAPNLCTVQGSTVCARMQVCKLDSAIKSVSAGMKKLNLAQILKTWTGTPHFTVLHRCWVFFFLTNRRQDTPPAKGLRLTLSDSCFIMVVWTNLQYLQRMPVMHSFYIFLQTVKN